MNVRNYQVYGDMTSDKSSEAYPVKSLCDDCVSNFQVVTEEGPSDVCEECGYETQPEPCAECDKTGVLACPECDGKNDECEECNGSGEIECENCNGNGFLED